MHPGLSLNSLKHQLILMVRAMVFFPAIQQWYGIFGQPFAGGGTEALSPDERGNVLALHQLHLAMKTQAGNH